jgi:hypothetical protein
MVKRRKFVVGLGSLAAGGAAAMGTGAFSQSTTPGREMTIQIADSDLNGGIGLKPGNTQVAYIDSGTGELEIDLSEGLRSSASGMNPNSTYYFGGEFNNNLNYEEGVNESDLQSNPPVFDRPLFSVVNQSVEERRVKVTLNLVGGPSGAEVTALAFQYGGVAQAKVLDVAVGGPTTDTARQFNISPGDQLDFVMIVESGGTAGDLQLEMTIETNAQR